jgi:hypothetical protein
MVLQQFRGVVADTKQLGYRVGGVFGQGMLTEDVEVDVNYKASLGV